MTSRERWLALLSGEKPDCIPTDYWATWEVTERLMRELECADVESLFVKLHIDAPARLDPPRTVKHHPDDPEADQWGMRFRTADYGLGTYSEAANHPLAFAQTVEDIHAYKWPSPDDCDYGAYEAMLADIPGHRSLISGYFEPYLLYCWMRGMEQAMMDLIESPGIAEAALGHIFDYTYAVNQRVFEIGAERIDMTMVAEDLGSQTSLLMSPDQIRRFILPNQKKMADLARSHGIHIFYHTDGAARDIIPDLISVTGIEILNPIQWRCPGMEREGLVRDFGDKVIFHGAIDNQQTLPFGTPEDVRDEVLESIEIFRPARWICAPCHNIQAVSSTANIVAMYETIHEHGRL